MHISMCLCDCQHAANRVPVWPHEGKSLGGTHNNAAVQGKDKALEFPSTNPYAVTEQHRCDISTDKFIRLKNKAVELFHNLKPEGLSH